MTQNADFTVTKLADVASVDAAGDQIQYTITVDNTGNTTLTGASISDSLTGPIDADATRTSRATPTTTASWT